MVRIFYGAKGILIILRKSPFTMMTLLTGVVFALVGCVSHADNLSPSVGSGLPAPAERTGQDSGWPSSSKLSEYSLGGWNQPAGIGGIMWTETQSGQNYYVLGITFTQATAATRNSINNYLKSWAQETTWTVNNDATGTYEVTYVKTVGNTQYTVYATWNTQNGGMGSFSLRRATL